MLVIIMGVSGAGKTTLGKILQKDLGLPFYDGDDFHSKENIIKMKKGKSLNDLDRKIWLQNLSKNLRIWGREDGAILACSALKESYRQILISKLNRKINWIILYGKYEIIINRVRKRKNHYFKAELLNSQYSQLELPNYGLHYNVEKPIKNIAKKIVLRFNNDNN